MVIFKKVTAVVFSGVIVVGKTGLVLVACGLMARKLRSEEKKREESIKAFQKWKSDMETDLETDSEIEKSDSETEV